MAYQLVANENNVITGALDTESNASIPVAPGNRHWNQILELAASLSLALDGNGVPAADGINILAPIVTPLIDLKTQAKSIVDSTAGCIRSKYITIVPGQEATYIQKAEQAAAYIAAGYPSDLTGFQYIAAELTAIGVDHLTSTIEQRQQVSDLVVATRDSWVTISANIEGARLLGKNNVDAATDKASVDAAKNAALTALNLL